MDKGWVEVRAGLGLGDRGHRPDLEVAKYNLGLADETEPWEDRRDMLEQRDEPTVAVFEPASLAPPRRVGQAQNAANGYEDDQRGHERRTAGQRAAHALGDRLVKVMLTVDADTAAWADEPTIWLAVA